MMRALLSFVIIACSLQAVSQFNFTQTDQFAVSDNDVALANAWAGGINCAQVSRIDINNDGLLDLFIFDRLGNRFLTFLNQSFTPGNINYKFTWEYDDAFPELRNWVLLRDFNCDGAMDIFTAGPGSMKVYRNTNEPDLAFELEVELLNASYNLSGTPFNAPVYAASVDVPSIIDFDGDGDLDIFSWTELASTIYYYKNESVENSGECGLEFRTANRCYGQFSEASESSAIFIGDDFECSFNVIDPEEVLHFQYDAERHPHTGGCICQIDLDADGVLDMMISDVTETYITEMWMDVDADDLDFVYDAYNTFPAFWQNTEAVGLRTFPCSYYEDINNDGIKDLLVSPNATVDMEDDNSLWLYLNNGQNAGPDFQFIQDNFLQNTMIEVGRGAYPVHVDWNGDGLMDLVIANKEYSQDVDEHPSQLLLMENVGTAEVPAWNIIDHNWLDIPQYSLESIYPAFGDLDGDGDEDLILGEESGNLHFFRNTAGAGNEMAFTLEIPAMTDFEGESLDIGAFSTPQLIDLNGDDLLDIIVGEKNGNVNFIANVGTNEDFSFEHQIDTIGDAVASNILGIQGYSVPHMFEDSLGDLHLILGNEVGTLNHFTDIEGNLDGTFTLVEEAMDDIWRGTRSAATLFDFNNDGELDLVYGQIGGGVSFFGGGDIAPGIEDYADLELNIYPNPTRNQFKVVLPAKLGEMNLELRDPLGRIIETQRTINGRAVFDLENRSAGVYFVTARLENFTVAKQVIKF